MSRWNPLIVQIDKKLGEYLPSSHSTCSIFKVPSRLRHVNERAFEPEILSIGPYHRGKDKLKMMEEHKKRYLQQLLQRRGESSVERYVTAMSGVEAEAREYYDQSEVSLGQDEFVEMLLLDGCFIVELIRKYNDPGERGEDDPVFKVSWILSGIETDMLLLENQLPFFVLPTLFTMTSEQNEVDFFCMALSFCRLIFPGLGNHTIHPRNPYMHLLDMLYYSGYQQPDSSGSPNDNDLNFIRNAKELQEAGIKFKKRKGSWRLFDVDFSENGTIEIPCLKIYDKTESLFRNLVAYEQCSQCQHLYVTDYIILMDCLISSQEDVQILRHSGIIENGLGDDGMVCSLFNKLGKNVKEMSRWDPLIFKIDEKLRAPCNHSTCSIFKVPSRLRHVNERAFEPEILSIGPYHRGKDKLKMMEEHKKRYLQKLLQRRGESSVERYVTAMSGVEAEAREYYDQSEVSLGQDEFVEMLLLDGCFIVELIRKYNDPGVRDGDDPVFKAPWILSSIETDMLLLENQLPFFVLRELFTMTPQQNEEDFFRMPLRFFRLIFPGLGNHTIHPRNPYMHLLDMLYYSGYQQPDSRGSPNDNDWKFIGNAKELQEAGIKFKKREGSSRLFDVYFLENGTIEIPCLEIYDRTESLFRNLVAYEQCSQRQNLYVADYITLMDCLISTQEDVQILRHSGIIENGLGDDGKVCSLFNNLGKNVILSHRRYFCYNKVFDGVKEHCNRKRNVWMAKLKRDYFNSPWALLSFLAAFALLLFTLAQTVFTIMSYFQKD